MIENWSVTCYMQFFFIFIYALLLSWAEYNVLEFGNFYSLWELNKFLFFHAVLSRNLNALIKFLGPY